MVEPSREHWSAVVRVDIPSGDDDLIVQLIEVGPDDHNHRLIGLASDSVGAGRLLAQWLDAIVGGLRG